MKRVIETPFSVLDKFRDKNGNLICTIDENGVIEAVSSINGLEIAFQSTGNTVVLYKNPKFGFQFVNSRIWLRKNDTCIIKDSQYPIRGLKIGSLNEESKIYIGQNFSCAEAKIDIKERKTVKIGDDCMFSTGINILTSDMHAIFNESGVCINPGGGVTIGNHVWVGKNAMILKGVCIPENSIVGASAVVTKPFYEPGSVIVGNPAKAVKVGFNWDRKSPESFL